MQEYIKELKKTDLSFCENASSFLQSAMWGEFKSRFGWTTLSIQVEWSFGDIQESTPLLVLCRRLAPGFSFAYIPWGPQLPADFPASEIPLAMKELAKKLKTFLAKTCVFARFEPAWAMSNRTLDSEQLTMNNEQSPLQFGVEFVAHGFKKAPVTVQAPDTVIVDLSASCEEILAAMKPKWRYNVLLAGKKDVKVSVSAGNELETFYNILKETAQRDGISIHSFSYYKTLFEVCETQKNDGYLRLYTASHEGEVLAGIVVLFRGKEATYLYGASSNNKRNLMAPYALQWQAMQDAKEAGCLSYDLFGIPPDEDPNHPMAGLYRFKTGFGGQIVHRMSGIDFPYRKFFYSLFNAAERLRKRMMDRKKGRKR